MPKVQAAVSYIAVSKIELPDNAAGRRAIARLAAIVDSSYDAIIGKDLNSIITDWNQAAEKLFGYTADEAIGQSVLILIPEGLHHEEAEIIDRVRRGERVASYETTRRRKDGTYLAVSLTISPIRDEEGKIIGASKIARDITQAKENERRIRMLMREVNHRVKNQFAVILSVVRETSRRAADPREFEEQIRDRIMALSRSHDLLVSSEWVGASLLDLLQEHLKPFGHDEQISLSGPLVTLQANAVQHLGMAFHELGTNSSKYGAWRPRCRPHNDQLADHRRCRRRPRVPGGVGGKLSRTARRRRGSRREEGVRERRAPARHPSVAERHCRCRALAGARQMVAGGSGRINARAAAQRAQRAVSGSIAGIGLSRGVRRTTASAAISSRCGRPSCRPDRRRYRRRSGRPAP